MRSRIGRKGIRSRHIFHECENGLFVLHVIGEQPISSCGNNEHIC